VHRLLVLLVIVTAQLARAEPCPPAATLTGDDDLVRAIRALLGARGIADETPRCPAVRARVERRGAWLVVGVERPGGAPGGAPGGLIERSVSEVATAATVIESWTRSDVAAPLLASREVPVVDAPEPGAAAGSPPAARGIQLFAAEETSIASDGTVWQGMQLEACIMLGPICAAARLHGGKVISQPASWDGFERHGAEVYVGIDVPIAIGRARLTPGFAAGYGEMFTRHASDGEPMGMEIGGPRAEVHAAVSWPLTAHLAVDLVTTGALTQATRIESRGPAVPDPALVFPAEPRALLRFAVGVRYGAL
jgi:hypothetical protein